MLSLSLKAEQEAKAGFTSVVAVGVVAGILSTACFRCDSPLVHILHTCSYFYTSLMITMIE